MPPIADKLRRAWRTLGGDAMVRNALGVLTVAVAALAPTSPLTGLLLLGCLGLAVWPLLWFGVTLARRFPPRHMTATTSALRIYLGLAVIIVMARNDGALWDASAVTLLSALTVVEQTMRRPVGSATAQVANLPGWEVASPSKGVGNALYTANLLGIAYAVPASWFQWSTPLLPIVAFSSVVLAVILVGTLVRYVLARNRLWDSMPRILEELEPSFAFHWQAPAGTAYQAAMWLPYLERIGKPFFVLVRTAVNLKEVAALTTAPVIFRPGLSDLDVVITPSLKVVFYANTAVRNSHMIRFPHLTHIQLNHGDSDKIASVSPTFRQYDKNFVAGQAAIDRFATHGVSTHPDQFVIVGRPQLEGVRQEDAPIREVANPTVLYSPTWSGFYADSDYSSLKAGTVIVQALLDRQCTVIFRSHPYSRRHRANSDAVDAIMAMLSTHAKETGRDHVFGARAETEWTVQDCFNASDAMISDVSSLVSDYLFSGKPFAMAAVSTHREAFRQEFPLSRCAYVFDVGDGEALGLAEALDELLGTDSLAKERRELRTYYLGDASAGGAAQRFIDAANRFLDGGR